VTIILKSILTELNDEYFNGEAKVEEIRWMKRPPVKVFGRYHRVKKIIEINSILRKDVKVMKFVIMHELCHAVCKRRKKGRKHHDKSFWRRFKQYGGFNDELRRYYEFIALYWIKVGYIDEQQKNEVLRLLKMNGG